jgi:hypothetical protein
MRSVLTAFCLFASTAHAVPAQFTHQGRLLDADGAPLGDEATIMFRVTDSEVGGTALWEETITTSLTNGFYSAVLGASDDNPLDTDVLSQAPVWLELQLDGEPAMFPRSPINAVPYATMATVAEELFGGPVDASHIAVDGTPVVNELGEWVGPAPTVNWTDIEGMPEDFADGIDDDTDTDTDSFAALGTSCLDGDIPVWDSVLVEWVCDMDQDTLAGIGCLDGQLIRWSGDAVGWMCADDADTLLTEDEVDAMVSDNGYAMASEVFSGSFLDLVDVAPGLADGDDDTQLTEDEVDAMVSDNGYAMAVDGFGGSFTELTDLPDGLEDGDDNTDTLLDLDCAAGEIAVQTESGWACSTIAEQLDADSDGAMVWLDCDDTTSTLGSTLLDADCDSVLTADDCDDSNPDSTIRDTDGDCDGVLTADDCDDDDPDSTITDTDADCDGVITAEDCDDSDPDSTIKAIDPDCDGATYTTVHTGAGGDDKRWNEHLPLEIHTSIESADDCAALCVLDSACTGFMYKFDGSWTDGNPIFQDKVCSLFSTLTPSPTSIPNLTSARMD